MARKEKYTKEEMMQKATEYIKIYGIENFNVRSLAKYIGCSTQPLFRNYENMNEFKKDLKKYLHRDYEEFIHKYVDKKDYLFTISYAYALYAKEVPNIFQALFITDLAGTRTVQEVIHSSWNRETMESMVDTYTLSLEKAEEVYRDVRFYTHGLATQLCCNSIQLDQEEMKKLISHQIEICIK